MAEEAEGTPESGDVYVSETGEYIGTLEGDMLHRLVGTVKRALYIQIMIEGEWYVYKLHAVSKQGEEDAAQG